MRADTTAELRDTRAARGAPRVLELAHRQRERAGQREPTPEQRADQAVPRIVWKRAQRSPPTRTRSEHCARYDVQYDAVQCRLEPPDQRRRPLRWQQQAG